MQLKMCQTPVHPSKQGYTLQKDEPQHDTQSRKQVTFKN